MANQIVRRNRNSSIPTYGRPALWGTAVNTRNLLRMAMRRRREIARGASRAANLARRARERIVNRNRRRSATRSEVSNPGLRRFWKIAGKAAGPTYTTTRMIVRRTPRQQRFLRKLLRQNPLKNKFVNRFGFAWMGATAASKTIWYSVCHLKFNNVVKYIQERQIAPQQAVGTVASEAGSRTQISNGPDAFIYLGKCTFTYELYNPTNYIMTVFIYDLVCKKDTPYAISYNAATSDLNSAPEACMNKGSKSMFDSNNNQTWAVADPTLEVNTFFNTIGMKPTDYHLFNTLWKVKGMKKIVLPPTSSHHHIVIYNPKKKITNASLFYPRERWTAENKNGLGGITQATLFGFQGQVAVENNQSDDNTTAVGTLPGKLIINCVKKVNVWTSTTNSQNIISESSLKNTWDEPKIFTDLIEQTAEAV